MTHTERAERKPKSRLRRRLLTVLGVVVVVLVALVALGPTIAAPFVRPMVEDAVNAGIKGRATVSSLGLGWFGAQRAEVSLDDPDGARVADVSVRVDRGLLGLALGSRDLGVVFVAGNARVVRDASGTTNLQRAIEPRESAAPSQGGTGGPVTLPGSLAASVVLEGLSIEYEDPAIGAQTGGTIGAVRIGALTGSASFAVGTPAVLSIKGPIATGRDAGTLADSGELDLQLTVNGLTDQGGTLTIDQAVADLVVACSAPAISAEINAQYRAGLVERTGPTRVTLDTAALSELVPAVAEAMAAQPGVEITTLPEVSLRVERLALPLEGGLAALSAAATIETTRVAGTVEAPDGQASRTAAFEIAPARLALDAPTLAGRVTLEGSAAATIDGDSAGVSSVALAVGGLLDEQGGLRSGVPDEVEGSVRVEGFSTPILQPFVAALSSVLPEGLRIDLPQDIGPAIDLAIDATSHTDRSGAYDVDIALDAAEATLDAAITVDGQRLTTRGEGVRGRFTTVAPVVDRFVAAYGVRVNRGAVVTLNVSDLAVDLGAVGAADGPDLRGVRARADVALRDAVGKVQFAGDDTLRDYRVEELTLGVATDDLAGEVGLVGGFSARLNGQPLASASMNMTLAGLLDTDGAPATGRLPALRGEIRAEQVALDTIDTVFGSLYRDSGLVLTREVGPRADMVLLAASNPGAGADATNLDLTFRSRSVDITAPLLVNPDRLRSRGPVTLVDRTAARSIAALMGTEGAAVVLPEGAARLVVTGLDVPITEQGIRPDQVTMQATLTLEEFAANVGLPGAGGEIGPRQRIGVPRLEASAWAAVGAPPRLKVDGQLAHADQPFTLAASTTLHGLFLEAPADPADPMSVIAPQNVVPEASFALTDVPATLARFVPRNAVQIDGRSVDIVLLTRDTLGRTFDVKGTARESDMRKDTARYAINLDGGSTRIALGGRLRPNFVSLDQGTGSIAVSPRVAAHLNSVFAPASPVAPVLTRPATIGMSVNKPLELRLLDGFAPDFAGEGVLDAAVTLDASLAAITLPAGEGDAAAEPLTIPPVTAKALRVAVVAPTKVMTPQGGNATVRINGGLAGAGGTQITGISGNASARLVNGAPVGETPVTLTLSKIDGAWIDTLLGKPSLVAGAIGDRFDVTARVEPQAVLARSPQGTPITLNVVGPRFSTESPIGLAFAPKAVFVRDGVNASWLMGPRWANLYFLGSPPGGAAPAFAFTKQTRVNLNIQRLAIATEEGAAPLKPGVFIANMTATIPELAGRLGDGRDVMIKGFETRIGRGPTPDQLGLALSVPRIKVGDEPEVTPTKNGLNGRLASFTDADGNLTPDTARLTLSGGLSPLPTAFVDAFARQNGLLVDLLGQVVDFELDTQEFGLSGGRLTAKATAPFARAEIRGTVKDGLFVVDKTSVVEATQITQAATKRLQKALPLLASLEKTTDDRPARVIFETPIAVPMDGNFDRLNGKLTVDIGTARFGTADLFQRVLAVAQQKTAGEVGRRMPPLKLTMVDGLVSYEPYPLPLGEFKIETQGFINLGSKPRRIREGGGSQLPAGQLEVLTFIPAGAFAAEAVPGIANLPVPVVGNLARLPIRTSGQITSPKNDVAIDLVGQNAVNTLLSPGKLLEDGPGSLLEELIGGGGKEND